MEQKTYIVRITEKTHRRLMIHKATSGENMNVTAEVAINKHLDEQEKSEDEHV